MRRFLGVGVACGLIVGTLAGCGGTKVNASFVLSGAYVADVADFDGHGSTEVTVKSQDRPDMVRGVLQIKIWPNGSEPKRVFRVHFDGQKTSEQTVIWTSEFPATLGTIDFVAKPVGDRLELRYQGRTTGTAMLDRTGDFESISS